MTTTLTVTAKGQVTLRKEILAPLGIKPGDKINVSSKPDGTIEAYKVNARSDWADIVGILKRPGQPVLTLEQIKEAIEDGWAGVR